LRWEKPVGKVETSVLGKLISPKNSKIPRRNKGISNGGLGVTVMVVLERKRESEVRKMVNGEVLSGGLNPQKLDSPVFPRQPKLAFDNLSLFQGYTCIFKGLKTME
jgi:hypothetical protein